MASSLLSVGQRCCTPHCNVVDFLPILCPTCERTFCSSHIHGQDHECFQSSSQTKTTSRDFVVAAKCHLEGCDAVTMEAAGLTRRSDVEVAPIGREVRCFGCQEAFCASHRHQEAHHCPAPTYIEAYEQAVAQRKKAARDNIRAVLPNHEVKAIPKAPAGKVLEGLNVEEKLGRKSVMEPAAARDTTAPALAATPLSTLSLPKTKEDKLRAIALMKLKSEAVPGSASVAQLPMHDRWYLSWYWDEKGELISAGRPQSALWFNKDATVGRVIDDLARNQSIANRPDVQNPEQNLHLVLPQTDSKPLLLDNASHLSNVVAQGETVALVRGLRWQNR